ncbi:GNAT family N-acetyltransferase [Cognatishimia sp. SS12]|uniref:GNAT family N-acetyltransferase n=1 Tax=Cognatishimia sp. SS12 TaxID=2979465 RepID=UPI00232F55A4|nr:GNAT family N-acetyltransferase [Cognatishimia sp. SS12]MDC0738232.1 GNAT family N-acetyltransferase [Cognatishimia sp. SS12]
MTVILRPAMAHDSIATSAIMNAHFQSVRWMPKFYALPDLRGFCREMIARSWVSVAVQNGEVIGFLARHNNYVHALYVTLAARGQGVGQALLARAQGEATALDLWTHQANSVARRFYQRAGFHEVESSAGHHNDEGLPDVRYYWQRGAKHV